MRSVGYSQMLAFDSGAHQEVKHPETRPDEVKIEVGLRASRKAFEGFCVGAFNSYQAEFRYPTGAVCPREGR